MRDQPGSRCTTRGRFLVFHPPKDHKMKKQIGIFAALWLAACAFLHSAHADSSFILFQGDFGPSGAEQTFKFQISYPPGALTTGQNLLDAIFGTPVLDGTDAASGRPLLVAGTASQNVQYDQYSFGNEVVAFTFNSITIKANDKPPSGPTQDWTDYVAGGTSGNDGGPYSSGQWTISNDGATTRGLGNDSFDGWVFGNSGYDSDFTVDGNPVDDRRRHDKQCAPRMPTSPAQRSSACRNQAVRRSCCWASAALWLWKKRRMMTSAPRRRGRCFHTAGAARLRRHRRHACGLVLGGAHAGALPRARGLLREQPAAARRGDQSLPRGSRNMSASSI